MLALRFALNVLGTDGHDSSNRWDPTQVIYLMSGRSVPHEASYIMSHRVAVNMILAGLGGAGCPGGPGGLFNAIRDHREYLAAGVFLLAFSGVSVVLDSWDSVANSIVADLVQYFFLGVGGVALIEFVRLVLGQERTRGLL